MWKVCLNQKMRYSDLCTRVIKVLLASTTYTLTGSLEIDMHVLSNSLTRSLSTPLTLSIRIENVLLRRLNHRVCILRYFQIHTLRVGKVVM